MQLVEGLEVSSTVYRGNDGAASLYHCGKSIFGQAKLLDKLHITINTQTEAPGHGKWWLDGKMRANKCYCQQCMCCIMMPEVVDSSKNMLLAKWVECGGETIVVSPADKCVHLLSNPARVNGIKSKDMRVKSKGKLTTTRATQWRMSHPFQTTRCIRSRTMSLTTFLL